MKKIKTPAFIICLLIAVSANMNAQNLKDILNSSTVKNAVTSVTGGSKLSIENLTGTWTYVKLAVQLEGDNALKNIAGSVATSELENRLKDYCAKAGIIEGVFNYQFNQDNSFSSQLKGKSLKGKYTINEENKTVELVYGSLGKVKLNTLTAHVVISGNELKLLFDADKLLKFVSTVATVSNNSSLQALSKVANQYNGMKLGFDLKK